MVNISLMELLALMNYIIPYNWSVYHLFPFGPDVTKMEVHSNWQIIWKKKRVKEKTCAFCFENCRYLWSRPSFPVYVSFGVRRGIALKIQLYIWKCTAHLRQHLSSCSSQQFDCFKGVTTHIALLMGSLFILFSFLIICTGN